MDVLAIIVTVLFIALVACWVVLPGGSTVVAAEPETEAKGLIPSQQSA